MIIQLTRYEWSERLTPIAINTAHITCFEPAHIQSEAINLAGGREFSTADATKISLVGDDNFVVTETFADIMKLLGGVEV